MMRLFIAIAITFFLSLNALDDRVFVANQLWYESQKVIADLRKKTRIYIRIIYHIFMNPWLVLRRSRNAILRDLLGNK